MKRLLLFAMACCVSFAPVFAAEPVVNLWSGREQTLPGTGAWQLVAEHGRILASGNGEVRFHLPPLVAGTRLEAELKLDGRTRKVRLWSPMLLQGIDGGCLELPAKIEKLLGEYGLLKGLEKRPEIWLCRNFPPEGAGKLFLVFPDRRDFPLALGNNWTAISLLRAKIPGILSVLLDKEEQMLDNRGTFAYAVLRNEERKVVIFSPEFDFDEIENILLIKQLIEENKK